MYTNHIGQILIKELRENSDRWIEYRKYDANGRQIERAQPSAVVDYGEQHADLDVTLKTANGLIHVTDYYAGGDGGPAGRVRIQQIKRGSAGDTVPQATFEYTTRTAGGVTLHPVSKHTEFRDEDGSGALDTGYDYQWASDSVQMQQRTTTLPAVPAAQNGSETAATRVERFDAYGNLIWLKDERGYLWTNIGSASSYGNVTLYTGREQDTETGVYYYRNRYYGAELGRFASIDPLEYVDGLNLYDYVGANPVDRVDPFGTAAPALAIPIAPVAGGISLVALKAAAKAYGVSLLVCLSLPPCREMAVRLTREALESAAEAVTETGRRIARCLCKRRHPTYPSCPSAAKPTAAAAWLAHTPVTVAGWEGPILGYCTLQGAATNCGPAGGEWYQCAGHYLRWEPTGQMVRYAMRWSVSCCNCCYVFTAGKDCMVNHPDRPSGTKPFPAPV